MITLAFDSDSRLMVFAPHPDDEVFGCGIMLQRARAASAATQVVYATDGENNPWPQRFLERKWRLDSRDRKRWGELRRAECLAALRALGHDPGSACFLAMPDQGLTGLLLEGSSKTLATLTRSITDWRPTNLFVPSATDIHPDHNALAVMLSLVVRQLRRRGWSGSVWSYAVHRHSPAFTAHAYQLLGSVDEATRKMQAVYCHQTQLKLSRRRFLSYAARPELWHHLGSGESATPEGSVCAILRHSTLLRVAIRLSMKAALFPDPNLFLLGWGELDKVKCVHVRIPDRSSEIVMSDAATGCAAGTARYVGNGLSGEVLLPTDLFSQEHSLFVKLVRPRLFFDEAGWSEIPPLAPTKKVATSTRDLTRRLLSTTR